MNLEGKHVLDVTCGLKTIWFDKKNPVAVYCDKRREGFNVEWKSAKKYNHPVSRACHVDPDILCDFTDLPFEDGVFELVVFDPPHVESLSKKSWMYKKYTDLSGCDDWRSLIKAGYQECMRVLKPFGVLIFKWSDISITTREILTVIGAEPLFGHRSGKKMNTHWMAFMKLEEH